MINVSLFSKNLHEYWYYIHSYCYLIGKILATVTTKSDSKHPITVFVQVKEGSIEAICIVIIYISNLNKS